MSWRVRYGGGHAVFTPTVCFVVVLALQGSRDWAPACHQQVPDWSSIPGMRQRCSGSLCSWQENGISQGGQKYDCSSSSALGTSLSCFSRCSITCWTMSCMSFNWGKIISVLGSAPSPPFSVLLLLFPADHYMQVLACKHDCVRELATRSGRISPIENFLPLHYDYLQFAYYRGKACPSVPYSSCWAFFQLWIVSCGNQNIWHKKLPVQKSFSFQVGWNTWLSIFVKVF